MNFIGFCQNLTDWTASVSPALSYGMVLQSFHPSRLAEQKKSGLQQNCMAFAKLAATSLVFHSSSLLVFWNEEESKSQGK